MRLLSLSLGPVLSTLQLRSCTRATPLLTLQHEVVMQHRLTKLELTGCRRSTREGITRLKGPVNSLLSKIRLLAFTRAIVRSYAPMRENSFYSKARAKSESHSSRVEIKETSLASPASSRISSEIQMHLHLIQGLQVRISCSKLRIDHPITHKSIWRSLTQAILVHKGQVVAITVVPPTETINLLQQIRWTLIARLTPASVILPEMEIIVTRARPSSQDSRNLHQPNKIRRR